MFAELIREQTPVLDDTADAALSSKRRDLVWPDPEPDPNGIDQWLCERHPGGPAFANARVNVAPGGAADSDGDPGLTSLGGDELRDPAAGEAGHPDNDPGLGSLGYGELRDRMVGLVAERNRVEGEYMAVLGELTRRYGPQAAAHELRDQTRMNSSQARSEARLAESLVSEGFTDTLDAMQAGQIHMSHARVIAREAPKKHRRSEGDFLELARAYPSDTIARHPLAYHSQQVEADLAAEAAAEKLSPIDAELALQRHERSASLRMGDDGMWHLRAKFDFLAGRELSTALEAQLRSLRRRNEAGTGRADGTRSASAGAHGPHSDDASDSAMPTRRQLLADALVELVAGAATARHAKNNLIIVADYDATSDRLANPRLDDGTPLSAQMLVEHAVDAKVLPAMFSADWSELALGRTRNASDAQRLVLAVRDGGCIGCTLTSEHTEAHHIDFYENDSLTEIPNLASMCQPCHRDLHTHGHKIHTPPDGRPRLQSSEPRNADPPVAGVADAPTDAHRP
jgi:hypothetical protein